MPPSRLLFSHRLTRTLVLWLLALVVPLQGAAVGVFAVTGPLHVHRAAGAPLVLEDVRRWKAPPVRVEAHGFGAFGHVHGGAFVQRHHHARGDPSVVATADDQPGADEAIGVGGLALLAMAPVAATWPALGDAARAVPRPPWSWRTGFVAPLERPPRPG